MLTINTIYNEDCLEGMTKIDDKSIDMILCDLPYGTTACKWDVIIPFDKLWQQYNRIIKDNGAIALTGTEPFSSYLRLSNLALYHYDWVWSKSTYTNFYFVKKQPAKKHETISVFYKKQPNYNPQMEEGTPYIDNRKTRRTETELLKTSAPHQTIINVGQRYPSTIQFFNSGNNKSVHPTQKPVPLFEYLIKTYTTEGNLVLDNCIGSGTTAIACINTNRNFIGFELEAKYFDIANQRISNFKKSA